MGKRTCSTRGVQEGSKTAQERSKRPQDRPRPFQNCLRRPKRPPKRLPRCPKQLQGSPQEAPRRLQEAPKTFPRGPVAICWLKTVPQLYLDLPSVHTELVRVLLSLSARRDGDLPKDNADATDCVDGFTCPWRAHPLQRARQQRHSLGSRAGPYDDVWLGGVRGSQE